MAQDQSIAYIALGSNLGDRQAALRCAYQALVAHPCLQIDASADISPIYETIPVDCPPGSGEFLNGVIRLRTTLPIRELFELLLNIERQLGRERVDFHGARSIDLDLLFFDGLVYDEDDLTVPHPRLHLRMFVLVPMCDLAPELIHPRLKRSMRMLLQSRRAIESAEPRFISEPHA
ncbi:MAG: 2-amino-4-hydroxy-6-hydroxymethyldihydropteridine diphosphokinase [Planctomycetota bacterium]|jgi:2-amino-4-hydroxy-6-hydroxymethyldihydropteridine diphosphokinase